MLRSLEHDTKQLPLLSQLTQFTGSKVNYLSYWYDLLVFVRNHLFRTTKSLLNRLLKKLPIECMMDGKRLMSLWPCDLPSSTLLGFLASKVTQCLYSCSDHHLLLSLTHPIGFDIFIIKCLFSSEGLRQISTLFKASYHPDRYRQY